MWSFTSNGFLTFAVFLAALFIYVVHHYGYWARRKVPYLKPIYFVGNLGGLLRMKRSPAEFIQNLYNHPRSLNQPIVGIYMFHKAALLIREPELVKRVLVRDFSKFRNRYSNSDYKGDPMGSQNIFFLKNPMWKEVRLKLSPFFTSAKMKQMFYLIEEIGRNLNEHLLKQSIDGQSRGFILELKELCALYTTDVIASVAYGVEANSFTHPNGDFRRNGREVFQFNFKRAMEFVMVFFLPQLVPLFGFKVVPPSPTKFLRSTINYVMAERELSGLCRNDLIDILLELKTCKQMTNDLLVAQAALFFTAGFETSSSTMSFALYELAKRMDLQERVRAEIGHCLKENDGRVTQKMIESLEYMHMVICEVLRLYPPLPFLDRDCTVESRDGGYSLQPFHNYAISSGTPIYVPVYGLHMDAKYFKDPQTFDPERFAPANKKNIVPYTYMPFGLGPHACIGERLGLLQTKIGLTYFLLNHYVRTCSKTQLHMRLNRKSVIVQAEEGIYLDVVYDPLMK